VLRADRPGRGLRGVGRSDEPAQGEDGVRRLEHHGNGRARADQVHEPVEEVLADVHVVHDAGLVAREPAHREADDAEAGALHHGEHLSRSALAHRVRLDDHEGPIHARPLP
jgi:hypothetical protein